jgi:hypothetical protein
MREGAMPQKATIYSKDGSKQEMWAIDAREAVRRHPKEWAFKPFDQKAEQKGPEPSTKDKAVAEAKAAIASAEAALKAAKTDDDKKAAQELLDEANKMLAGLQG